VSRTTVLVGVAALAVILVLRFSAPRVPGALVLVIGGLIATPAFNLEAHGVALVGTVPRGLPTPGLPALDVFQEHSSTILAAAAGLLLIGFSQTAGDARAFAARHRYRVDVDQESGAQGMANMAAGAFHGMPVSTSLSASSLNESAGARTPLASLVTGGLVLLTLIALAPLFSDLPKAVPRRDHHRRRRLRDDRHHRIPPPVGGQARRLLGGGDSNCRRPLGRRPGRCGHRHRAVARLARLCHDHAGDAAARSRPETHVFRDALEHPSDDTFPGYAVVRLEGGLFFATAEALEARVRALAQDAHPPLRVVVLDMEGVDFVDSQGAATLAEILDFVEGAGVRLSLARVKPSVGRVLATDGVLERLGADGVHDGINLAVEAQLAADLASRG
jgi:anti-anti-sigma factor